ncbi:NAD(P)H-dependent oxidoreductase [Pedobacter nutrimenti]|uniref:Putative NADPH-quinone reductase n=1 Tax=Pedobacter nutrimenti TaxID=1241337 RepID=A0A318UG59_9SPHI|nr:NAD(P)H-dependent oxidoreductase [Pedobacter nutrimenti]PYF75123.1 putative NADPH-quinone reductase [Pedobacter nutrimenti]
MKTLVIVIHPDLKNSKVNKRWTEELKKYPEQYKIHDLYHKYPDEKIDVSKEQQLLEAHDKIVFQFPVFWHSCPSFLKKWIDEVFLHGWAYGSKSGYKMSGKKIALAMSAGIDEHEYGPNEKYRYTLEELTRPLALTFEYVKADYQPLFAYYGMEFNTSTEWIEKSVGPYVNFLNSL